MKAILTKYMGPGNVRGSRIKAYDCDGNSVTIPYPHQLRSEDGHKKAAQSLCDKMKWTGELIGGRTKDGMAFVFAEPKEAQ